MPWEKKENRIVSFDDRNSGEINQTYLSVNHFEIWHGHRLRRNSRERKRKEI